ncbi:uncharacterized protein MELLADRAFT_115120 [Melampsora larici-populina 98AG31]|uniref:Uncharacterized protein n=1 Tax=Melampsora larici-populina (strain 98AG31 / pathotype 3-4-7) TaxID=747676 RepID=F4R5I6_MELLP|nr:uncharacterized protein MELLADRAFT_115120 [Melampsora larici-populina 98AG31]EGG12056.1 hypothetical protein MELLADRAFT_115120 [Melampsora larici-populina 98AG31]
MYDYRFKLTDSISNQSNQIKNQVKWSRRTKTKSISSTQPSTSFESHQKSNRSRIQLSTVLPTILIITSFIPIAQSIPIESTTHSGQSHSDSINQNDDRSDPQDNLDPISLHQAKPNPDSSRLNLNDQLSSPSLIKQFPSPTSDPSNTPSTLFHLDPSTSQSSLEYTSHPDSSAGRSATFFQKPLSTSKLDQSSSPKKLQHELPSISTLDALLSSHDTNSPPPTNPPSESDSQQHTSESPHPNSQLSFSPSQSHRLSIPVKSSIPTYFENVNGTWVLSDNWNLYGLSGPSQRHRARSLPTNNVQRSSKQPRSAPLVHHTSLAARTNELESNASFSNSTNNNMNSSTNLDLPAGWNHTSPRGPMYVVPAIVIASLFIAISVVGTVVCLVGRRRKNKRISSMRRNEEAEIEGDKSLEADEKKLNEMSEKGKRKKMTIKHLLIVQFKNQGSKKKQEIDPSSLLILDESPRLGKRSFRSGIGSRLTRRRNRASDKMKGTQTDKTTEDDQSPSSGCSGSSADAVIVNELSGAPKPLTDDASGTGGSRGTTDQSSAPITNTSHGHDTLHTASSSSNALSQTITSFNLQRLATDESQTEALTVTALTRQSAQLERADEQRDRARSEVSSVHNSLPSLQISQHPSLQPIMGPRSIFPDDPHLEDLPPEPPAYTTSHDKLVLGNIARLASSAPISEPERELDQGPSAPPLVWEELTNTSVEDQVEVQRGILPAPSMSFVTKFDPNRKDEEKLKKKEEEEMKTWALLVEPSRPEDSDEERREREEVGISVPEAEEVEGEVRERERERERREIGLPIAPPYEEEEEIDQG